MRCFQSPMAVDTQRKPNPIYIHFISIHKNHISTLLSFLWYPWPTNKQVISKGEQKLWIEWFLPWARLRHPKEGHFNDLSQHQTSAFRSAHQNSLVAHTCLVLGFKQGVKGECEAFCTGGVVRFSGARVETANTKGKLFIIHAQAVHSFKAVKQVLLTL